MADRHGNILLQKPSNENVKIWRYMNFASFVSLLQRKALFFTSIAALQKSDPLEGALPIAIANFPVEELNNYVDENDNIDEEEKSEFKAKLKFISEAKEDYRWMKPIELYSNFVNCWHINEYESLAMWKLYCSTQEGIAIQSTYRRLEDSFIDTEVSPRYGGGRRIMPLVRMINYVDHFDISAPIVDPSFPYLYFLKHKSFEHERELRAMLFIGGTVQNDKPQLINLLPESVPIEYEKYSGIYFPVDPLILIENIFAAPNSPIWFYELIEKTIKQYDLNVPVVRSVLLQPPTY
jgi:hypothetical protein